MATRTIDGWRTAGWGIAAVLLLVPLIAMRFTDEVQWTSGDFVFAAVLIGGTGSTLEVVVRRSRRLSYRAGVVVSLLAAFLLVWVNAAVGIIGDEGDPRNGVYLGVLLVAGVGTALSRLRAAGLARAMAAAAMAQAVAGAFAVASGGSEPPGTLGLAILNGAFVLLFTLAALLFGRCERVESASTRDEVSVADDG